MVFKASPGEHRDHVLSQTLNFWPIFSVGDLNHAGSSVGLREASPPGSWALQKAVNEPGRKIQRMKIQVGDVDGWEITSQFCGRCRP